jgi:nitrous oxide reductase accessory protein NosL
MKTISVLLLAFSVCLSIDTFSVSGKLTQECKNTLYSVNLHNGTNRVHCSLFCVYTDNILYGIDMNSIKKYNPLLNRFVQNDNFKLYSKSHYEKDLAYEKNINNKYYFFYGKKLYETYCKNTRFDFEYYFEKIDMLDDIKDKCKTMDNKNIYPLMVYLWKEFKDDDKSFETLEVKKDEKCPVCGMFIYKYPKWITQIFFIDTHLSFDGVKDMLKFYFNPKQWNKKYENIKIENIKVSDYYSTKAIDGKLAYYVLGSNIYGPMGKELIPFEKYEDAKEFMYDHKGEKIYKFSDLDRTILDKLD